MRDLRQRRMRPEQHGHEREAAEDEQQREALEAAEIAGAGSGDDDRGGGDYAQFLRQAEIVERQADDDEAGPQNGKERLELGAPACRGPWSPCRIVPRAPWMGPIWASSSVALRCSS